MRIKYSAAIALMFLLVTGCAHYGALDEDRGKSYNMAKQGQILNPDASKNLKPVTGLHGAAVAANEEKYIASFRKTAQKAAPKSFVVPMIPVE